MAAPRARPAAAPAGSSPIEEVQRTAGNKAATALLQPVQRDLDLSHGSWSSRFGGLGAAYYGIAAEKQKLHDAYEAVRLAIEGMGAGEGALAATASGLRAWFAGLSQRTPTWDERADLLAELRGKLTEVTAASEAIKAAQQRKAREAEAAETKRKKQEAHQARMALSAKNREDERLAREREQAEREAGAKALAEQEATAKAEREAKAAAEKEERAKQRKADDAVLAHFTGKQNREKLAALRALVPGDAALVALLDKAGEDTLKALLASFSAADLPGLLDAEAARGVQLLELAKKTTDAADLRAALGVAGVSAATLVGLLATYTTYAAGAGFGGTPTALEVAHARANAGRWANGTFADAERSLLYHYKKHVLNEGGGAASLQQYVDDAVAFHGTGTRTGGGDAVTYRQRPRGGIYTSAGVPLSYWYVS